MDTITTGEDGTAQSQPLYLGKFQVKEIQFPHGMVDTGENVTNVELVYAGQEVEVTETSASFYNQRQKALVTLDKVLEQDETFGIGMNGEISAVTFGLYAQEDITAADGSVIPADGLAEQEQFRDWLLSQPPAEILNHAYEYTVREDILMSLEYHDLEDSQARALLKSDKPLKQIFERWENQETSYMDTVWD